jgi:murein DD-endopeptidase MepM/ murein hydrolase activator NlpD
VTNAAEQPTTGRALRRAGRADDALVPSFRKRWISRTALLGAVAAATIISPLTGAYASSDAVGTTVEPAVTSALESGAAELPAADALRADPAAGARAVTTASRDRMREALKCPGPSEANGALSAAMGGEAPAPTLVRPAAEGTYRVTSPYGPRTVPFPSVHEGTDFAGALGTPLYAVADGTIVYAGGGRDGRSGQIVILRAEVNGATYDFWYGHMFTDGVLVSEGQEVKVGQQIAEIGNNGNSTGPHLHFEVHDAGNKTTDPAAFLQANGAQPVGAAAACA